MLQLLTDSIFLGVQHVTWYALIEHAYLLAIFGMVTTEGDVLQLEEVIALVTLERTKKADVLDFNKKF